MAILEFDAVRVRQLIEHAKAAPTHRKLHEGSDPPGPCLWLVGDQGVYLMSNGHPHLTGADGKSLVAYGKDCNPHEDEDWWETKSDLYGGDDGADELTFVSAIEARLAGGAATIRLALSSQSIELL